MKLNLNQIRFWLRIRKRLKIKKRKVQLKVKIKRWLMRRKRKIV